MTTQRETISMNGEWRFRRGDLMTSLMRGEVGGLVLNAEWLKADNMEAAKTTYDDAEWATVRVPHDFVIESPVTPEADCNHGARPVGIAWYRKTFDLPAADAGRSLWLEFDGVFRDCSVWLNGQFVGRHLSGYTSFHFDITAICNCGGPNALAVRVDASRYELWSYEGGGIYRAVRLVKTSPVYVAPWGTFVRTEIEYGAAAAGQECSVFGVQCSVPDGKPASTPVTVAPASPWAKLNIETTVANDSREAVACDIVSEVRDPAGHCVAKTDRTALAIGAYAQMTMTRQVCVSSPELWHVDRPALYTLLTRIERDGAVLDEQVTTFGIRHIRFDAARGFLLNGQPLKLKGVCCHQDHAGVGVAVPPSLHEWRIARLKSMGCNALRTSHNPPDPALLDACDRLGLLVMDETRLLGTSPEILGQFESLIRRDRNHPSVILWSLGNEEMGIQHTEAGIRVMRRMQDLAHRLDPTRPVTYAMNMTWIDICDVHAKAGFRLDVFGANYINDRRPETYDEFHAKHPDWPLCGVENASTWSARGVYVPRTLGDGGPLPPVGQQWLRWTNPQRKDFVSAYGDLYPQWGGMPEEAWRPVAERPHVAGTFVWTGFDYRGETGPYPWPAVSSNFGILDLCGFPKDIYYYYKAWWSGEPVLHLFPHWNWPGREGQTIDVWCFANCASVELFLNGTSLGRQDMPPNGHLEWHVAYVPGKLEALGYDVRGARTLAAVVETTGAPRAIRLTSDRMNLSADGADLAVIEVAVVDAAGRVVPDASHDVRFEVSGPAQLIGVGNGDPFSHEPDKADHRRAYCGLCQVLVQTTETAGQVTMTATSTGLIQARIILRAARGEQ